MKPSIVKILPAITINSLDFTGHPAIIRLRMDLICRK